MVYRTTCDDTDTRSDKPTVKALGIPQSEMLKWTPIHEEAKSMLLKSVSSSSRCARIAVLAVGYYPLHAITRFTLCSLIRVSESKRKVLEEKMDSVITKLKSDLESATAPRMGRLKFYTDLDSRIVSWNTKNCELEY